MQASLIFVHGGPGFRDYLRPYFEPLSSEFTCVFYDQRQGLVDVADLVEELRVHVAPLPRPRILVGHSWGAILALEFLKDHEVEIDGFVMMSTGLNHRHFLDEYHAEVKVRGLEGAELKQIFLTQEEYELGVPLLELANATFSVSTFNQLRATYLTKYDLEPVVRRLRLPMLHVFGELDIRFPVRLTRTYRALNAGMTELEIGGAGHFPFLLPANRERVLRAVREFALRITGE